MLAVLGVLQLLPVQKKTPSPAIVPRPAFTACVHSSWEKEVKNVQLVPDVQAAPAYVLYSVAVVPLHTPATRREGVRASGRGS